ncbi:Spermidine/putrescine import ATP-binding protein PotA [Dermatophilus congolensis]|uniref:Spermidine/putrescine import ATP-binding protein PotA n=5 Tax=Dermatophilus congolensis TaxID=1863 RepID=A0A239V7J5_9MICO|nr:Spermidine/putrescine import ATP-binding protein PotA [Dermatophilus congolensis]
MRVCVGGVAFVLVAGGGAVKELFFDGRVRRGGFVVEASFEVFPGQVLALLGPNGAGKSSVLRAVAGLEVLESGQLRLGAVTVDNPQAGVFVSAQQRNVGVMFQDYRLFGHMSVVGNVAFGLRMRGVSGREATARALQWLQRLGIGDLGRRRPGELSGGQAQRVALARALACEPDVLVLDEPTAALDSATRREVQGCVREHVAQFRGPVLLVTHDPVEAMVMADAVMVVEEGRVVQYGPTVQVAEHPATEFVADLVGVNLFEGVWGQDGAIRLAGGGMLHAAAGVSFPDGARVFAAVRPESVSVFGERPGVGSPRNVWRGRVLTVDMVGARVRLHVAGPPDVRVEVTAAALVELGLSPGMQVWLSVKATEVSVYFPEV